jgi:hypothetical protein
MVTRGSLIFDIDVPLLLVVAVLNQCGSWCNSLKKYYELEVQILGVPRACLIEAKEMTKKKYYYYWD